MLVVEVRGSAVVFCQHSAHLVVFCLMLQRGKCTPPLKDKNRQITTLQTGRAAALYLSGKTDPDPGAPNFAEAFLMQR